MKANIFRPVEFWKSAIMTLPDTAFFELMRSVFGKIKTPFNKQTLLGDLENFLRKADIQKTISCYIDRNDARVIAAVAILDGPSPAELESFFADDLNRADLHDLVINLEERLILYRFHEKGESRLALNPVLEPVLSFFTVDTSALFPSFPVDGAGQDGAAQLPAQAVAVENKAAPLDDRILAALLSFVSETDVFFKTEGKIRKRIFDTAKTVFPALGFETVMGSLWTLGLFYREEDRLLPDYRRFADFGGLDRRQRLEYWAAGIFCYRDSESDDISPWLQRLKIRGIADFIHQFYASLDGERLYPRSTLKHLTHILERDMGGAISGIGQNGIDSSMLIDAMAQTGLVISAGGENLRMAAADDEPKNDTAHIVFDTPFSLLLSPSIGYNDAVILAAFSTVIEADLIVRFQLNRTSVLRGFSRDISAEKMIDLLKGLSLDRIDDSLVWTIRDWEKRYREVSLRQGLILSLAEERRYLAETKPLASLIRETLAPGIYLLDESVKDAAEASLRKAGVDIVAHHAKAPENPAIDSGRFHQTFGPLSTSLPHSGQTQKKLRAAALQHETAEKESPPPSTVIAKFHSILDKMHAGREDHAELAARIDRRLVISESQLKDAVIRYEKLEAHGLDYVGKAAIARQAITMQAPLEIVLLSKGQAKKPPANEGRIFGIPLALEREGGDSVLVIKPVEGSGDASAGGENGESKKAAGSVRIPLGKISLLRRIKKSIFEQ